MIEITKLPKSKKPKKVDHIYNTDLSIKCKCKTCGSKLRITDILDIDIKVNYSYYVTEAHFECPNCIMDDPETRSYESIGFFGMIKLRRWIEKIEEKTDIKDLNMMVIDSKDLVLKYDHDVYKSLSIILNLGRLSFVDMLPKRIKNHPRCMEIYEAMVNNELPCEYDEVAWLNYDKKVSKDKEECNDESESSNSAHLSLLKSTIDTIKGKIITRKDLFEIDEVEEYVKEHDRIVQNIIHHAMEKAGKNK